VTFLKITTTKIPVETISKLIQLKNDGISERIKKPRTAPVIGTAAKIEEAFAVPIDLAAKAVKYNPKIFGTNP
tara:strand:+ start:37 stop:255 length:219 start_codon:yes stop_codon:yes gene_type:complete